MTDTKQQVVLTEDQKYLQGISEKFNVNPEDTELTEVERVLLKKVILIEKEISELITQFNSLNEEMKERQEKINILTQQLTSKKGQSQGIVESLLLLRYRT